jgi:hypothetical protein
VTRRNGKIWAVLATGVAVLVVLTARPADAGVPVEAFRDFTFNFRGQPLTCTVRGHSEVDYDELGGVILYYQTTMLDEKRRCLQAFDAVAASMEYWRGDATQSEWAETSSSFTDVRGLLRFNNTDLRDSRAHHTVYFICDDNNGSLCQFHFTTDGFPFDSPK